MLAWGGGGGGGALFPNDITTRVFYPPGTQPLLYWGGGGGGGPGGTMSPGNICPWGLNIPRGMKLSKQVYEISNLLEIFSDEYH